MSRFLRKTVHTVKLPSFEDLAAALRGGGAALAVGGVVPEARSLPLAALLAAGWPEGPALIVVPGRREATEVVAGLGVLAPTCRVALAPSELSAPYLGTEPPLASRLELVSLLGELSAGRLDLVVAPARALLARVPEPSGLAARTIEVEPGGLIDPLELAEELAGMGYERVDLVESAGQFAVRGGVVDLHPGGPVPYRLELDDLVVERLQAFDPGTQRSLPDAVERITVPPLEPFSGCDREELAARLEPRYPALAGLIRGGAERRLWWALEGSAVPSRTWTETVETVVVCDRDEVLGDLGRWWRLQEREWSVLSARHVPLPPPDEILVDPESIGEAISAAVLRIERLEVADGTTRWWRLSTHPQDGFQRRLPELAPAIRTRRAQDMAQVLVVGSTREADRFAAHLREAGIEPAAFPPGPAEVAIEPGALERGFLWDGGLAIYGRRDLTAAPAPRPRRKGLAAFAADLRDLRPGDLVVHADHGIGRFTGFRAVTVEGRRIETMVLQYHEGDTLLVPVERADLIQRYSAGDSESTPRLDRLGGGTWRRRKARVKKAIREMAAELLRLAAVRAASRGYAFSPDSPWQREFEDSFEFELTPDQERAVAEIKADMESPRPMDRLLCGDVGFGKTEVALRAVFKAVLDGKQVAVLAPTTVLVEQHLQTFRRRFEGFPIEVRMLSRFIGRRESREILDGLAQGTVDVVIGTHRLLGSEVRFRDLGLVILDEEQRFGVGQKERLKKLRTEVDVLAMSATPIPRTLNMALSGLRDISLIETPPRDRQAIQTDVLEFSEAIIREAVLYELERGGQVFFVHNRVRSIGAFARWLERVVPEARIAVAHGQMNERHLERAMRTFLDGEADVLLATAIIENGLDIPNANTLLVNRADRFGLAQLYQLRGRVGRSERLAFAYFLVPPGRALSPIARARLAAMQEFCELGTGFRIAARDLEIRGAGNLLGGEQHGFLEAVGFETYAQLLDEAVAELEGRPLTERIEVEMRLGLDLQLPGDYIPEPSLRLSFYKRLAACDDEGALADLLAEIRDRYGEPPAALELLASAQRLRMEARRAGVVQVVRRGQTWTLHLDSARPLPKGLGEALEDWPGARVKPSGELVLPGGGGVEALGALTGLLSRMVG